MATVAEAEVEISHENNGQQVAMIGCIINTRPPLQLDLQVRGLIRLMRIERDREK